MYTINITMALLDVHRQNKTENVNEEDTNLTQNEKVRLIASEKWDLLTRMRQNG